MKVSKVVEWSKWNLEGEPEVEGSNFKVKNGFQEKGCKPENGVIFSCDRM